MTISKIKELNEYQKAAVQNESRACLVNANVGSGKTTVLIEKILHLHNKKNIRLQDMVVLTFTNKAADEIRERLKGETAESSEPVGADELWGVGTFHSVALRLLKEKLSVEELGYTKDFFVIEPDEELEIAESLISENKLKIKYKNRLKKRLEEEVSGSSQGRRKTGPQDDLSELAGLLREEKRRQDKMTFQDLLANACALLRKERRKPAWIIIDEVQDCDEWQLEMIDCLMGEKTCLFAVGDPNQVIYSWRGSAFQVFYTLKTKYQADELSLPVNYRSGGIILEAARRFLQSSQELTGVREAGEKIAVRNHYDPFQEADYLSDKIAELNSRGIPYSDIAVFYRLQSQSKILEDMMARKGIPYEVSLKKTIKDIPVLNWLVKLLRFSLNPRDVQAGVCVLYDRDYGAGITVKEADRYIRAGLEEAADQGLDGPVLAGTGEERKLSGKAGILLKAMLGFRNRWKEYSKAGPEDFADRVMEYFDLDTYLRPSFASFAADRESVRELLKITGEYICEEGAEELAGMGEFLNSSSLYGINILKKEIHSETDSVKLMTLHASKGLEFSYVFIIGVNYGLIPLRTKSFEEEEEERRLFFVGMTRAKDHLELSWYTSPGQPNVMPGPGRYLNMIPAHLIDGGGIGPGQAAASGEVRLQELKREILKNREKKEETNIKEESSKEESSSTKRVSHKKYGPGTVEKEDDTMITVLFDDYGRKEFMKMFSELESI